MTHEEFILYFKKKYRHTSSFLSGMMLLCVDAIAIFLTIGISFFLINAVNPRFINFRSFVSYSIYLPLILLIFYVAGLYPGIMISPAEEVKKLSESILFSFLGIALSILVEESDRKMSVVLAFILAVPIAAFTLPTAREIARHFFGKFKWWGVPVVIYCSGTNSDEIITRLTKRPDLGNHPAVILDSLAKTPSMQKDIPVFPPSKEIYNIIKKLNIKVAILCDFKKDISSSMMNYRYVITVPKNQNLFSGTMQMKDFAGIMAFGSTHHLTKKTNIILRRAMEFLLLLIMLPFALPIICVTAILIKITSPGPIFFGHTRIGKNRKKFKCWKFRSMYIDADVQLEKILKEDPVRKAEWEKDRKFADDPRVTPIGKIIRKTSIDELPQLWNIFTGQMSFVGPRPVTESELLKYGSKADIILSVTPGVSGMWQVSGRSNTGYEERIFLDGYYIQNWSIWLDLWIVIKTIWVVFSGKGAY